MSDFMLSRTSVLLVEGFIKGADSLLTNDKRNELKIHPIGSAGMENLEGERLCLRKSIAKKFWESVMQNRPKQCVQEDMNVLEKFPPFAFYTNTFGIGAARCHGICEYTDYTYGLHLVIAASGQPSNIENGVLLKDVVKVDEWSTEQRSIISSCNCATLFFDPCAWIVFPYC